MLNLATMIRMNARERGDAVALKWDGGAMTFAELNTAASQVASGLREAGIQPGDRVALCCPTAPPFVFCYYGILMAGAVAVGVSGRMTRGDMAYVLEDSGAKVFLCHQGSPEGELAATGHGAFSDVDSCERFVCIGGTGDHETLDAFLGESEFEIHATEPQDAASFLYTSGTTGRPKGVVLTHSNLFTTAVLKAEHDGLRPGDVSLVCLPMTHVFGQVAIMSPAMFAGATLYLEPMFAPPRIWQLLDKEEVTVFGGVPTMYWGLYNTPRPEGVELDRIRERLRVATVAGAPMPVDQLERFERDMGIQLMEGYGLTEASAVVTYNTIGGDRKPGSAGQAIWGVEIRIVDEQLNDVPEGERGQLLVRGHGVMRGYHNHPELTAETIRDGWLHSGDVGYRDKDGFIFITDRLKDIIIRGGYNVSPRDVEEVLNGHDAVLMCAVIGVPDERMGEEVKAFVVKQPDAELDEATLIDWLKERLPSYAYPRLVEFREELPLNPTGKVLKRLLRG